MRLNTKADSEDNEYILSYLPKIKQETFTLGSVYRHYAGAHVQSIVVSHSYLNNRNTKYRQNDEGVPDNLMLRLRSTEQETKFRFENKSSIRNWKINLGVNLDYSQYSNTTFQKIYTNQAQIFDYHTYLIGNEIPLRPIITPHIAFLSVNRSLVCKRQCRTLLSASFIYGTWI